MSRHLNLILAAVFLLVGVLATANTIRLNNYIAETVPRDAAQEQCNTETIETLKVWIQSRISRDGAMDARDDAAVAALEDILASGQARPEHIAAWRNAVANDRAVRAAASEHLGPLPNC